MNKDLVVTLKAHGVGTVAMNLPNVSAVIHARENNQADFFDVLQTISEVLHNSTIADYMDADNWDIDEIHDGDEDYGVGLFDYDGNVIIALEKTA